jgi:hypothetical protein
MSRSPFPANIICDAIADTIGGRDAPRIMTRVLHYLEQGGWRFTRPDDPAFATRMQAARAFADVLVAEAGIDPDEIVVTVAWNGREHRVSLARWMAAIDAGTAIAGAAA